MGKELIWKSRLQTYKAIRELGKGGNGKVYLVKSAKKARHALKVLLRTENNKSYTRFKDEVTVLYRLKAQQGVIPLLDYFLPEKPDKDSPPFYVMPLGVPLVEHLKGHSHKYLYELFLIVADGLRQLHEKDITHRDIKPANILFVDGLPVFSDFGLANFPKKQRISAPRESIGAKWTIAPEMQRIATEAEYKKADVYSLAKSLWILITGQSTAFEGQYIPGSSVSIKRFIHLNINEAWFADEWCYHSVVLLEKLLIDSTSNDPEERPTAEEFTRRLLYWFNSNDEYEERNPYEWENALERIFPIAIPTRCEWIGINHMDSILQILLQYDSLAYIFMPSGGGDHLRSLEQGPEPGGTLLFNGDIIMRPVRMSFELIKDDLLWSYFRLESATVTPITEMESHDMMETIYYGPNGYTIEYHPDAQRFDRIVSGTIIITANRSWLNHAEGYLDAHSGYQSQVSPDEYRGELEKYREKKRIEQSAANSDTE